MANLIRYLSVPSPRQPQIVYFTETGMAGSTDFFLRAGWKNNVPNYYKLKSAKAYVITSAVVANRVLLATVIKYPPQSPGSGAIRIGDWVTGNIAASQTARIELIPIGTITGVSWASGDVIGIVELSGDILITGDDAFYVDLSNDQAGDLITVCAEFEYLNHKEGITEGF